MTTNEQKVIEKAKTWFEDKEKQRESPSVRTWKTSSYSPSAELYRAVKEIMPPTPTPLQLSMGYWVTKSGKVVKIEKINQQKPGDPWPWMIKDYCGPNGNAAYYSNIGNNWHSDVTKIGGDHIIRPLITKPGRYMRKDGSIVEIISFGPIGEYTWKDTASSISYTNTGLVYATGFDDYDIIAPAPAIPTPLPAIPIDKPGVYETRERGEVTFETTTLNGKYIESSKTGSNSYMCWQPSGKFYTATAGCEPYDVVRYLRPLPFIDFPVTKTGVYRSREGKEVEIVKIRGEYADTKETPGYCWSASGRPHASHEGPRDLVAFLRPLSVPLCPITKTGVYKIRVGNEVTITQPLTNDPHGYHWQSDQGSTWTKEGRYDRLNDPSYENSWDIIEYLRPLPLCSPDKYGLGKYQMRNGDVVSIDTMIGAQYYPYQASKLIDSAHSNTWAASGTYDILSRENPMDLVGYLGPLDPPPPPAPKPLCKIDKPGVYKTREGKEVTFGIISLCGYSPAYIEATRGAYSSNNYKPTGEYLGFDGDHPRAIVEFVRDLPAIPITKVGVYRQRDGKEVTITSFKHRLAVDSDGWDGWYKDTGWCYSSGESHPRDIMEFLRDLPSPPDTPKTPLSNLLTECERYADSFDEVDLANGRIGPRQRALRDAIREWKKADEKIS